MCEFFWFSWEQDWFCVAFFTWFTWFLPGSQAPLGNRLADALRRVYRSSREAEPREHALPGRAWQRDENPGFKTPLTYEGSGH